MKSRIEAGEFRAVIDREYPLEAIADAYRYVETGRKTGIAVINVRPPGANAQGLRTAFTGAPVPRQHPGSPARNGPLSTLKVVIRA